MLTILFRTLFVYLFLVLMMRLMGKRQIGELEISDLITTLLLSEIASLPITNHEIPVMFAVIPIITLVSLEIFVSVLLIKFPILKNILSSRPNIIINRGRLCQKELKKLRMSNDELISILRQSGVTSLDEVYYAIIEENGTLSVIPKSKYRPLCEASKSSPNVETGLVHVLVSDGKIDRYGLQRTGIDKKKLLNRLNRQNVLLSDVFLMLVDDAKNYTIILKEEKK